MFRTIRPCLFTLVASLPLVVGCASTSGHDQADTTASNMERLNDNVATLSTNLTATSTALQDVVSKASADPRPAFSQFDTNVATSEAAFKRIQSDVAAAQAKADAYFAEWAKNNETITDEDLKKAAMERRDKLTKTFEPVITAMGKARDEVTPLIAKLKDTRTFLANDLTPAGIKSIDDTCKKIGKDTSSANDKLKDLQKAVREAAEAFRVSRPPPPQPAPAK